MILNYAKKKHLKVSDDLFTYSIECSLSSEIYSQVKERAKEYQEKVYEKDNESSKIIGVLKKKYEN